MLCPMAWSWHSLTERQIRKALAEGKLSKLEGEGQPLPNRSSDTLIDPGLAAGHRIMAAAGVRPQEFDIKDELDAARKAYAELTLPEDKKAAMARIAELEMKYELARDSRRAFFR